ncbi:MAG: galactose mutarotase [Firmicutes bacterium]|nr:galactose mutarotase [Bacillota bacterium]
MLFFNHRFVLMHILFKNKNRKNFMEECKMNPISKQTFGTTKDGCQIDLYTLTNKNNMQVMISTFGGTIVSIKTPDKTGMLIDVALGYDKLENYETQDKYIGALIGRHGNRIQKGHFTLNGKKFQLYCNDGNNHLHGGKIGFDKKVWSAKEADQGLSLTYVSANGEEGYPGTLKVEVLYSLTDDNTLSIDYKAISDEDTVCNLTNHTYFNLAGYDSGTILKQKIQIFANCYTDADKESLPTGKIVSVAGTPLDLREPTRIGDHIDDSFEQLQFAGGYDHNWVIDAYDGTLKKAAFAFDDGTGITLTASTTLPGLQFYSGNYLDGAPEGKNNSHIYKRCGFCLESQYFPNALEHPKFEQPIIKKGETWHALTTYQFGLTK